MSYPAPSDFTSNADYAAWWQYALPSGAVQVCATTGANVVARARAAVGLDVGPWDASLQSQLVRYGQSLAQTQGGDYRSLLEVLGHDLNIHQVSLTSLAFAIWLAWYRPSGLRLDAVALPANATPPSWGARFSMRRASMVCWDPTTQSAPGLLDATQLTSAEQQSASGVRGIIPSVQPSPPPSASSKSLWVLAGGFALLVWGSAVWAKRRGKGG